MTVTKELHSINQKYIIKECFSIVSIFSSFFNKGYGIRDTGYGIESFFENFSESIFQIFNTFFVWVRSSAGRASGF